MAKTIDLNERALEKERKQYSGLCRILKFFSAYCLICPPCIVSIIICRLLVEKPFDGMYMVAAHEMIMCLTTFLVFNHLFRLFKKLERKNADIMTGLNLFQNLNCRRCRNASLITHNRCHQKIHQLK